MIRLMNELKLWKCKEEGCMNINRTMSPYHTQWPSNDQQIDQGKWAEHISSGCRSPAFRSKQFLFQPSTRFLISRIYVDFFKQDTLL